MDMGLYDKLMEKRPDQHPPEWRAFMGICDTYLKEYKIERPIVVELGIGDNNQKKFYKQLFGAEHIGVDRHTARSIPDVLGDTHDPKTLGMLKEKLGGKLVNVLFIDACHCYRDVKRDFEMYSPLCTDIVAFHDIERDRYRPSLHTEVWKFWDELKNSGEFGDFLSLSIHQHKGDREMRQMGIGVLFKNV